MPIDFRYHLTSLVAVFLALALGILLGSNFIAGSSVERQVAKGLEHQFSQLQSENREQQQVIADINDRLNKCEEFERGALPLLVGGRLAWRRVAIIQTGDYTEAGQSAKTALETAGARVVSVTTLSNLTSRSAVERANRAVELIAGEYGSADPVSRVLQIAAECIATGAHPDAMGVLEQKGLVAASGDYNLRISTAVIVGGGKARNVKVPPQADLVLIDALAARNVVVVGCEPFQVGYSYIPTYHKKQIPTVDNVDMPMGQVALVFAILEDKGNFGLKKSADRVLPQYFENRQWRQRSPR